MIPKTQGRPPKIKGAAAASGIHSETGRDNSTGKLLRRDGLP
jgi:hypothetical protein